MSFLHALFLKLLYPTSLSLFFLGLTVMLRKRKGQSRACFSIAVMILLVCGNGWLVGALIKHLEWKNLPPNPVPRADAILVLSGGLFARIPPRPTAEVADAGDRLLYGAHLFRQGKAPYLVCTGNVATGGVAPRPAAEEMAEFLQLLGVESRDIITETKSQNTHEHAQNLAPIFQARGF